jgi:hypothetical protein
MSDPNPEQDERIRQKVINLLANDIMLEDYANLQKDCKASLLKQGETQPEMIFAAMLAVSRAAAETTLYRIFGKGGPGESDGPGGQPAIPGNTPQAGPPSEQGTPEGVFLDLVNKPGEELKWLDESLEDIIGPEEEEA